MRLSSDDALSLLDWKRRIFDLYAQVRAHDDPVAAWELWIATRNEMFREHPQSPLPGSIRREWQGEYFAYDANARVYAEIDDAEPQTYEIATSGDGTMRFMRLGRAEFELDGHPHVLQLYWLDAYGGGLFLPFRDATAGRSTYGAGRYLLDTVKGADLGTKGGTLVLDFNFSYNPSCAYNPRWVCPLTPQPNRMDVAIEAGEKTPAS